MDKTCSRNKDRTFSNDFVTAFAKGLIASLSDSLFMMEEPAAKHSAPNQSWPAKLSVMMSSENVKGSNFDPIIVFTCMEQLITNDKVGLGIR